MAITITIQDKESRDDDRQIVFFTVKKDGTDYEFSHGSVPASLTNDTQIVNWLKARKERLYLLVLRKMYPDADTSDYEDSSKTPLEIFQAWIDGGHVNPDGTVIEKVPYKSNHPKYVKAVKEVDAISNLADAKIFLKKLVRYLGK